MSSVPSKVLRLLVAGFILVTHISMLTEIGLRRFLAMLALWIGSLTAGRPRGEPGSDGRETTAPMGS